MSASIRQPRAPLTDEQREFVRAQIHKFAQEAEAALAAGNLIALGCMVSIDSGTYSWNEPDTRLVGTLCGEWQDQRDLMIALWEQFFIDDNVVDPDAPCAGDE